MSKKITIEFDKMYKVLESNKHYIVLMYKIKDEKKYIPIEANKLNKTGLLNCRNKGLPINQNTVEDVYQKLSNAELEYRINKSITNKFEGIGFDKVDKKVVYKHNELIGSFSDNEYIGDIIKVNENSKKYLQDLFSLIGNNIRLKFIMMASLSSILKTYLSDYLNHKIINFIIHLYGGSSTGKTTALELAISMFTKPECEATELFTNWNLTSNSLIKKTSTFNGVPLALDELSTINDNSELSKAVYSISSGSDKGRLNSNGSQIETTVGNIIVFSSGEESINNRVNANEGIKIRMVEFDSVQWTDTGKQSNDIKRFINSNYGLFAPKFAKAILDLKDEDIENLYKKYREEYIDEYENSLNKEFIDRVSKQISLILTTTEICNEFFKLDISIEKIKEFMHQYMSVESRDMNLDEKFYKWFIEFIETNKRNFNDHTNNSKISKNKNIWGKITNRKNDEEYPREITIAKNKFQEIINSKSNFTSYEVILKKLQKEGILDHESDRLSRRRVIAENGSRISVYVIKVKNDYVD